MIRDQLFEQSPYTGFDTSPFTLDYLEESNPIFRQVIADRKPKLILEVGTWKGGSANHMARLCKELNLSTEIVCIDTWLGSWEHWLLTDPTFGKQNLRLKNGFPTLYHQFLANVILAGHADYITPLPINSVNGAILLKKMNVQADVIYIDGGHDYRSVMVDLLEFWDLLRPGGVLIGDDYHSGGPEVVKAANDFARNNKLRLQVAQYKFVFIKPPSPAVPTSPVPTT